MAGGVVGGQGDAGLTGAYEPSGFDCRGQSSYKDSLGPGPASGMYVKAKLLLLVRGFKNVSGLAQ